MAHSLFARKPLHVLLEELKGEHRLRRVPESQHAVTSRIVNDCSFERNYPWPAGRQCDVGFDRILRVEINETRLDFHDLCIFVHGQQVRLFIAQLAELLSGSLHCFGAFVDIGGIKGLLHVSEVAGDHPKAQRTRLDNFTTGTIYQAVSKRHEEWKRRDSARSERAERDARD